MAWASVSSPSSLYLGKNFKFMTWRYLEGQRYEMQQVQLKKVKGKSCNAVPWVCKSNTKFLARWQIPSVASDGHPPKTELIPDALGSEQLNLTAEDELSGRSSVLPTARPAGKPGFISFHTLPNQRSEEVLESSPTKEIPKLVWFVGPTVLVVFLVFPSLYMRRILSTIFEDSLLTDFVILFFTEALFYAGAAIFLFLVDYIWRLSLQGAPSNKYLIRTESGFRISSVTTLLLSLLIPSVTMGMVWPWTGPAASATLAPYLVGLVVQFAFGRYAFHKKSPAWPVIPVIFQVYRLHQLNRAAQLVTALSFSVRGVETTSQTIAINSSLGTLVMVLQILGVICIWSLASFLTRFIPSSQVIPES